MVDSADMPGLRSLTTPRAAAVAGVLFALLFAVSVVLLRTAIPQPPGGGSAWLYQHAFRLRAGLTLMPLAGIAFLWFVGVVRDRIGALEDRFFSTVFFGSSLLFLAMVFVSMATVGALVWAARVDPGAVNDVHVLDFGRAVMIQVSNTYALRVAAVLMISLSTIWLRTGLMPRWLVVVTYALALVLLVINSAAPYVILAFPGWVLVVSLMILRSEYGTGRAR
jgi:hypothetical protein